MGLSCAWTTEAYAAPGLNYTAEACATLGPVYTADACAAPGGVFNTAHGPELQHQKPVLLLNLQRPVLHLDVSTLQRPLLLLELPTPQHRGLSCTWM
jgi:hypothetical protein